MGGGYLRHARDAEDPEALGCPEDRRTTRARYPRGRGRRRALVDLGNHPPAQAAWPGGYFDQPPGPWSPVDRPRERAPIDAARLLPRAQLPASRHGGRFDLRDQAA